MAPWEERANPAPATAAPVAAAGSSGDASSPVPPPKKRGRFTWIGILVTVCLLALIGLFVLSLFPRGGDDALERQDPAPAVIEERAAPETATIVEIGEEPAIPDQEPAAVETAPPPVDGTPASPTTSIDDFSERPPPEGTVSEAQAVATLLDWVRSNNHYEAADACIRARSLGYENRGYTIQLISAGCGSDGMLGQWRVDTLTGKVYEQKPDGRYLDP